MAAARCRLGKLAPQCSMSSVPDTPTRRRATSSSERMPRATFTAECWTRQHRNFLQDREPMPQFFHPRGYHMKHFAWWADWAVELPDGYSALYTHPLNRFELPFLTTSGVVDNDKVHLPGTMPFFLLKGVRGILPAGTPYAQIIPFKREHWESEVDVPLDAETISAKKRKTWRSIASRTAAFTSEKSGNEESTNERVTAPVHFRMSRAPAVCLTPDSSSGTGRPRWRGRVVRPGPRAADRVAEVARRRARPTWRLRAVGHARPAAAVTCGPRRLVVERADPPRAVSSMTAAS